jgi:alpha-L-arabinofuranosidase
VTESLSGTVTIDPAHNRGQIDKRIFGSFVEHMGRCVYSGIYEPTHPTADADGFRSDVALLIEELGVTLVRYPGGNFVSGYRWEDGVGPRDARPARLDLAWRSIEPNTVGTDEFVRWATGHRLETMMAVNLGTRGIQEAADLVEYCNTPSGTAWSDLRRANGSAEPYGIKLWCLGNEMDGPWQTGHKTAEAYGILAAQSGRAMKLVDPSIELIACGSSARNMPTFGSWETTVLSHTYDVVDFISLHAYYEEFDGDRRSFLGSGAAMDGFIKDVVTTADAVGARLGSKKKIKLSFDEWNVWYQSRFPGAHDFPLEIASPRIEDVYGTVDAVVVGDLLISLLNNVDRVSVACQAQLVNVIAPIMTKHGGPSWRQTIFHPFAETSRRARGTSLIVATQIASMPTARYGDVPALGVAASHDPDTSSVSIFLVNRSESAIDVDLRHEAFGALKIEDVYTIAADLSGPLYGDSAAAAARPRLTNAWSTGPAGRTSLRLEPESWTTFSALTEGAS